MINTNPKDVSAILLRNYSSILRRNRIKSSNSGALFRTLRSRVQQYRTIVDCEPSYGLSALERYYSSLIQKYNEPRGSHGIRPLSEALAAVRLKATCKQDDEQHNDNINKPGEFRIFDAHNASTPHTIESTGLGRDPNSETLNSPLVMQDPTFSQNPCQRLNDGRISLTKNIRGEEEVSSLKRFVKSFDYFSGICDSTLHKYAQTLLHVGEAIRYSSGESIPTSIELFAAYANWYRIGRLQKHYLILKLLPIVVLFDREENLSKLYKFIRKLAYSKEARLKVNTQFLARMRNMLFEENPNAALSLENEDEESHLHWRIRKAKELSVQFVGDYYDICLSDFISPAIPSANDCLSTSPSLGLLATWISTSAAKKEEELDETVKSSLLSTWIYLTSIFSHLRYFDVALCLKVPHPNVVLKDISPMIYDCYRVQQLFTKNYVRLIELQLSLRYLFDNLGEVCGVPTRTVSIKVKTNLYRDMLILLIDRWLQRLRHMNTKLNTAKKELREIETCFQTYLDKNAHLVEIACVFTKNPRIAQMILAVKRHSN